MSDLPFRPYAPDTQPPLNAPGYRSTQIRHPLHAPVRIPGGHTATETSAPVFNPVFNPVFAAARYPQRADLTCLAAGAPLGERIIVAGRILDEQGRPQPGVMVEIWQANAAGRYDHPGDRHQAPLDPNFHGAGMAFSDQDGNYRFTTIKPGAYPWPNHRNAWRPNHIHFSLFGAGYAQRIVTQMYFPGDPLLAFDPIYHAIPGKDARDRLVAAFDLDLTEPDWALGYRFDIVLRGRAETPPDGDHH